MTQIQICELRFDVLRDLQAVRTLLESRLLRQVADAPPQTVRRLRDTAVTLRELLSAGDVAAALDRDRDLALSVVTLSGRHLLTDFWCQASDRLTPYRALVLRAPGSALRIPAEHEQVLRVLERAGRSRADGDELLALRAAHAAADERLLARLLHPGNPGPGTRTP